MTRTDYSAQYLNLVPTIRGIRKLGAYALCGLPESLSPRGIATEGKLDGSIRSWWVAGISAAVPGARHCMVGGVQIVLAEASRIFSATASPQVSCIPLRMHGPSLRSAEDRGDT
jgi:hypothetical protein